MANSDAKKTLGKSVESIAKRNLIENWKDMDKDRKKQKIWYFASQKPRHWPS